MTCAGFALQGNLSREHLDYYNFTTIRAIEESKCNVELEKSKCKMEIEESKCNVELEESSEYAPTIKVPEALSKGGFRILNDLVESETVEASYSLSMVRNLLFLHRLSFKNFSLSRRVSKSSCCRKKLWLC